jgi:hypothetical protein
MKKMSMPVLLPVFEAIPFLPGCSKAELPASIRN